MRTATIALRQFNAPIFGPVARLVNEIERSAASIDGRNGLTSAPRIGIEEFAP